MSVMKFGWSLNVVLWFQARRTALTANVALVLNYLTQENVFAILIPFIFWCVDAEFGKRVILVMTVNGWLNSAVKTGFRRPRPAAVSTLIRPVITLNDYGLPSSHTQTVTTFFTMLAVHASQSWITVITMLCIIIVGLSRLILGVHFPEDILGGTIIGLSLAAGSLFLETHLLIWFTEKSLIVKIGLIVVSCILLVVIHPILIKPKSPETTESAITLQGSFLGICLGSVLQSYFIPFSAAGTSLFLLLRFAIGLAGIFAIRNGLRYLSFQSESLPLPYFRYTLVGFWLTCGAPLIFSIIGLSSPTSTNSQMFC